MATCPNCGLPSDDGEEVLRCKKCCYTKEFMRYEEFGKLLGVCGHTIRRWEKQGRLTVRRFGPVIARIHRSEFDRMAGLIPRDSIPIRCVAPE